MPARPLVIRESPDTSSTVIPATFVAHLSPGGGGAVVGGVVGGCDVVGGDVGLGVVGGLFVVVDPWWWRFLFAMHSAFWRWCRQKRLLGPCAVATVSPVTEAISMRPTMDTIVDLRATRRERSERTRYLVMMPTSDLGRTA
jgi:hypothetical protein